MLALMMTSLKPAAARAWAGALGSSRLSWRKAIHAMCASLAHDAITIPKALG
jgi:hypothetical protein